MYPDGAVVSWFPVGSFVRATSVGSFVLLASKLNVVEVSD